MNLINVIYCDKDYNGYSKYYSFTLVTLFNEKEISLLLKKRSFNPRNICLPGLEEAVIDEVNTKYKKDNKCINFDDLLPHIK